MPKLTCLQLQQQQQQCLSIDLCDSCCCCGGRVSRSIKNSSEILLLIAISALGEYMVFLHGEIFARNSADTEGREAAPQRASRVSHFDTGMQYSSLKRAISSSSSS